MKTRLLYTGLLAATMAWAAPGARAGDTTALAGHVSPWATSGVKVGEAAADESVDIAVHMVAKNAAGLKSLADEVSSPKSEHYGEYLTPAAFAERFAPAAADVAAVQEMLLRAGMKKVTVGAHGMFVTATATVAQLEKTFGVTQGMYAFHGVTLRANKEAPTIPASLAGKVLAIEGLDAMTSLRQPMHHSALMGDLKAPAAVKSDAATPAAATVTPPPVAASNPSPYCDHLYGDLKATLSTKPDVYDKTLPWLNCGYTPNEIKAAYGFSKVSYDGTGVTVAIVDAYASPTLKYDLNRYSADQGLPPVDSTSFQELIPQGIYDVPAAQVTNAYGWWGEESLDVAAVHGSAPGATILYIGATDNNTSLTVAEMNAIYNNLAPVQTHSYSFGGESLTPAFVAAGDQSYMAAATMGITLLFSSGDDGDLSQDNGIASGSYPATSPYVTGAGGTSLAVKTASGSKSEYGWGNYRDFLAGATVNSGTSVTTTGLTQTTAFGETFDDVSFYAGSGGGISLIEPQPSYQAAAVPTALATSVYDATGYEVILPTPQRVSPDISMVADPYTGYLYGESYTIAGNPGADSGCTPYSATVEYCENPIGGTSLASPLLAGAFAVMNQKRLDKGEPLVGFVNPLLYSYASGPTLTSEGVNQIVPPTSPTAVLRGYASNLNEVRLVTINSAPFFIEANGVEPCSLPICEGLDDVFLATSPGYNNVTGLGVPWIPKLIQE
jgi:subtilase family serine protease